jgi:hypothetical protein
MLRPQTAQDQQAKLSEQVRTECDGRASSALQRQELDKVSVVGARLKAAELALPALSDDAKLNPPSGSNVRETACTRATVQERHPACARVFVRTRILARSFRI